MGFCVLLLNPWAVIDGSVGRSIGAAADFMDTIVLVR